MYFQFSLRRSRSRKPRTYCSSSSVSVNGSLWSERGNDTNRRPVSQLSTRQNTRPLDSSALGGAVVYAIGSYPYVWRRGADRKSTRLNSSHSQISYAVFCLKKKKKKETENRLVV